MVIYEFSKKQLVIPDGIQDYSLEELTTAYQSGYTNGYKEGNEDGYTEGYADGLDDCGDCDDAYNEGYGDGIESGITYQKSLLSSTAITSNGNYSNENGWNNIVVNVASGETINNQVKSSNLTVNGTYIVTYDSGYTGLERVDITVNVPQTGYTQEDLDAAYQSGYTAGLNDCPECDCSGYWESGYTSGWTDGYQSGYTDGKNEKYINVPDNLSFDLSGSTKEIAIDSNTEWVVTASDNWIIVTPTSGSGDGTITITVAPNVSGRTGSITVMSTDSAITHTITIEQKTWLYNETPLTIEMLSDGSILFNPNDSNRQYKKSWEYRKNGDNWIEYTNEVIRIPVVTGDILQFRGENITLGNGNTETVGFYGSTGTFNVFGNIMSLYTKTNFDNITTFAEGNTFGSLFKGCTGLINANNLILPLTACTEFCYERLFEGCYSLTAAPALPATTLASYCYSYMFHSCTSLTTAPDLNATILMYRCYEDMFSTCTSLNYIKCLATDISAQYCTSYWLSSVAASGTFVKAAGVNWPSGNDGIPVGWTIQDAS